MPDDREPLNYGDYLRLSELLACQAPESARAGQPAHDEMLFIIVHQAYELWFKQILHELDRIQALFGQEIVDDREIGQIVHGLRRIVAIQGLLVQQLDVLETMTPLDFLEFRDLLFPSSGFQSRQFRLIETRLGLRAQDRLQFDRRPFDARLTEADRLEVRSAAARMSLFEQVQDWLERTPFIRWGEYAFHDAYRQALTDNLTADAAIIEENPALSESERQAELATLQVDRNRFEAIFDPDRHLAMREQGVWRLSLPALQAALFINLYRDEPVLQIPFQLISRLMDLEEAMTTRRYRHALMVQRMIGSKVGTGGSSGHDYLRQTAERHRVFGDLFALSTFFIPRSRLPVLPVEVQQAMGYRYPEAQD